MSDVVMSAGGAGAAEAAVRHHDAASDPGNSL